MLRLALSLALTLTIAWPQASSPIRPIGSLTSDDVADLQFLKPLIGDARIVQLGEAGHGMGEVSQIKARVVRFLQQDLGFRVLAFESSLYLGHQADSRAADAPAQSTLTSSLVGVWHTREVLPLFERLKSSRVADRPIRLAGFDVQPIGSGKKTRPAFFRTVVSSIDPSYGAEVEAFDATFLAEYDKGSTPRRTYFRQHRDELVAGYERLAAFVDRQLPVLKTRVAREAALVARQEARSMAAYVKMQTASDARLMAEARDEGMAANVGFLADELYPGERIVVWGHNYHVSHAADRAEPHAEIFPGVPARSMGGWLRERFGRRLYTIGIYPYEGRAVDNSRAEFAIEAAAAGSLEARVAAVDAPATFLDVAEGLRANLTWLRSPVSARFDGRLAQRLVVADQFDAVIVVRRVSPPVFLY
jgi:erythromycin esterase